LKDFEFLLEDVVHETSFLRVGERPKNTKKKKAYNAFMYGKLVIARRGEKNLFLMYIIMLLYNF